VSEAVHPVPSGFDARIGPVELQELHDLEAADPARFWLDQARRLTWNKFPAQAGDWSFDEDDFHIRWYADGELNLSVNCLDRHLAENGDRTALIFEADEPGQGHRLTYRELYEETCRFANLLKSRGIKRGDRVMIYMPMIPRRRRRCSPAPVSGPSTPSCSAVSRPRASPGASSTATPAR